VSESVTGAAVTGFAHDADLSSAATIPATWYRDPRLLELSQEAETISKRLVPKTIALQRAERA